MVELLQKVYTGSMTVCCQATASGHGSSQKRGQWVLAEGEKSGEDGVRGITPGKSVKTQVQICAIWCIFVTSGHQTWDRK